MEVPELSVKSLADHLTVTHNHRANQWIRANSTPPALGKLKSSSQVLAIVGCKRGGHLD
jgi:hypothetical protein